MIAVYLFFVILTSQVNTIKLPIPTVEEIYSLPINEFDLIEKAEKHQNFDIRISRPDDDLYIERPCDVYDVNCIRQYFADHSRCKVTFGPVPNPVYDPQFTVFLPRINLTLTTLKAEYNGLDGNIIEFYINKKTDKLVLAVDYKNLTTNSPDNYFQFHRVGREPLVTNDLFNVTYPTAGSTITIPNLKNLQLQDSQVFSYAYQPEATVVTIGPTAFADPRLVPTAAAFYADVSSDVMETYLLQSTKFITSYIQYNICNFGLKVF